MTQLLEKLDRVIKLKEVMEATGQRKSTIYTKLSTGEFPPSFKLGQRAVGWRLSKIKLYLDMLERGENWKDYNSGDAV